MKYKLFFLSLKAFNNSEFISIQQNDIELISVFNFLCAKLNGGYNPKSNGLTDQSNHTIKNYLTSFVNYEKEWNQWLQELSFAYHTSLHSSTGFSPMALMFGRKVRVPIDLLYNINSEISGVTSIDQFESQLQNLYALARENMSARLEKAANCYDKKVLDDSLLLDDKVYVYLPRNKRFKSVPN